MVSKVFLFSNNTKKLNDFLSKFYAKNINIEKSLSWKKDFYNPVDISELIGAFVDYLDVYDINMWISLDEDVFIKISPQNADGVIKYLFERYPY